MYIETFACSCFLLLNTPTFKPLRIRHRKGQVINFLHRDIPRKEKTGGDKLYLCRREDVQDISQAEGGILLLEYCGPGKEKKK